MATWPANSATDWNTKMLAYLAIGHETDGTHGTKSGFQDRGDPAVIDYAVGDLTTDATWHDLDLGTDVGVPVGAKAVLLRCTIRHATGAGNIVQFRKNGNSNVINTSNVRMQVANTLLDMDVVVPCDSDRKIEYLASNTTFATIDITVKGWWI